MLLALLLAYWAVLLRPPALGGDTLYVFVRGTSMLPTYEGGDLVVIRKQDRYDIGDVVTFTPAGSRAHVIHRIVATEGERYVLRGDNRDSNDPWRPTAAQIQGTPLFSVPRLGLWMVMVAGSPVLTATLAGGVTFLVIALSGPGPQPPRLAGAGGPSAPPPGPGRGRTPTRRR
jgi:signal peptidase I